MQKTNILASIPGQYLTSAGCGLPDAATSSNREVQATVEVPGHGIVVITFERMTHKRGKSSHIWWGAKHAKVID